MSSITKLSSKSIKTDKKQKNKIKNEIKEDEITEDELKEDNIEPVNKSISLYNTNIISPYINTTLVCPIMLHPNQMDNKMYLHIKTNLNDKLVGKCYKNYGFISKIYKIDEISEGVIEAEDPSCSAKIIVKFSCRLCIPIKNKEIICKIDRMNKALISGINGPIKVIITSDKINKEKFFSDMNRNIRIKETSEVLVPNIYFIRVLILSSSFSDYDRNILAIGYLQDIATKEEITEYENKFDNDDSIYSNL